jgi:hypothetical protein
LNDQEFDELARGALASGFESSSEAVWRRSRRPRLAWLPTIPETLVCGCACGVALFVASLALTRHHAEPNAIVQEAMRDETRVTLLSVSRVPGQDLPQ